MQIDADKICEYIMHGYFSNHCTQAQIVVGGSPWKRHHLNVYYGVGFVLMSELRDSEPN